MSYNLSKLFFRNLTGLSTGEFGKYCNELVKCGIKPDVPQRSLSLPCMALLERSKTRQALDNRVTHTAGGLHLALQN